MRRHRAAVALVTWTFLVWTTRIANIWRDDELDTAGQVGRTALALSFTLLAMAAVFALWRRSPSGIRLAVGALAGWTAAVWAVRGVAIAVADHEAAFKVVHGVLALVSIALAALAARESTRGADRPAGINRPRDPASAGRSGSA